MTNVVSKREKVFNALADNRKTGVSAAQLKARGIGNPTAEISRLRQMGVPVLMENRTDTKGRTKSFYKLSYSPLVTAFEE